MRYIFAVINICLMLGGVPDTVTESSYESFVVNTMTEDEAIEDSTEDADEGNYSTGAKYGGFAESGTVMVVDKKEASDSDSLWTKVKEKVAGFTDIIEFAANVITIVGIITSVIVTAININKLAAVEDHPLRKVQTIKNLGVCFLCIALFGGVKLISVLIIKAVM